MAKLNVDYMEQKIFRRNKRKKKNKLKKKETGEIIVWQPHILFIMIIKIDIAEKYVGDTSLTCTITDCQFLRVFHMHYRRYVDGVQVHHGSSRIRSEARLKALLHPWPPPCMSSTYCSRGGRGRSNRVCILHHRGRILHHHILHPGACHLHQPHLPSQLSLLRAPALYYI